MTSSRCRSRTCPELSQPALPTVQSPTSLRAMTEPQRRSLLGLYALVLVVAAAVNFGLRAAGYERAGRAVGLLALIGVLTHAFIRSGRDTQPARTWAESWRRRHLLLIRLVARRRLLAVALSSHARQRLGPCSHLAGVCPSGVHTPRPSVERAAAHARASSTEALAAGCRASARRHVVARSLGAMCR